MAKARHDDIDISSALAAEIKRRREKAGLSLAGLAERAGLSQTYPGMIESGKASPTVEKVFAIAQALGISLKELVGEAERKVSK